MPQQVRGVIARVKGAPVEIATITLPDPGPGEVVVKIAACGVCHTDLTYREGGINDDFPFLLGHEAAGFPLKALVRESIPCRRATSSSSTGAQYAGNAAHASAVVHSIVSTPSTRRRR